MDWYSQARTGERIEDGTTVHGVVIADHWLEEDTNHPWPSSGGAGTSMPRYVRYRDEWGSPMFFSGVRETAVG